MDKLREAAQVALQAIGYSAVNMHKFNLLNQAQAMLTAALAEHAPIRKPIAWLCKFVADDGTTRTQFVEQDPAGLRWNDAGEPSPYSVTPLVDALAEQEPARVPLTEQQIVACITKADCHGGAMRMSYGSGPYEITRPTLNALAIVRAVERAHGIGAAP